MSADILGTGRKARGPGEGPVLSVEWPVGKSRYFCHNVELLHKVLCM